MKILVVCYSLSGKTKRVASCLADSIGADFAAMQEIVPYTLVGAGLRGVTKARARQSEDILPVEADVAEYDCVIVAGPVWGSYPAPPLYDFIREYELTGKQSYGLLTCRKSGKRAAKVLREELELAGTHCRSIITVRAEKNTIQALRSGRIAFVLNEEGKIVLHTNRPAGQSEAPSNQEEAEQESITEYEDVPQENQE